MMMRTARQRKDPVHDLERELEELRGRLSEAQETLHAIRHGEVDAVVASTPEGDRVFTLRGAETAYRVIVENISEGAVTLLPNGVILYANAVFSRLLDLPLERVIGTKFDDYVREPDRDLLPALFSRGLKETVRVEMGLMKGASLVPVYVSLSRLPFNEDKAGLSMVVTDISERKRAEEELRRTRDELDVRVHERTRELNEANALLQKEIAERRKTQEELQRAVTDLERSNRELQQFAYVASHDLQEPLRTVASYVDLLAIKYRGKLDDKADKYITFAVEGVNRMAALINDLLAYSRVGTHGKEFVPVAMNDVLAKATANLRRAISESGAVVSGEELPVVKGDATQLGQLLQNLLANAIKFRKRGVPPRIHVAAARKGGHWVFTVRDNGIGIEPQFRERIFTIFQRLHTRDEYAGTGVGLAISKRIVERHGGRIWVESEPGTGSTFLFTLGAQEHRIKEGNPQGAVRQAGDE